MSKQKRKLTVLEGFGQGGESSFARLAGNSRASFVFDCLSCHKIALVLDLEQQPTSGLNLSLPQVEKTLVMQVGWSNLTLGLWLCADCKPIDTPPGTSNNRYNLRFQEQVRAIQERRDHIVGLAKESKCNSKQTTSLINLLNAIEQLEIKMAKAAENLEQKQVQAIEQKQK
jgi:hypothetical protein